MHAHRRDAEPLLLCLCSNICFGPVLNPPTRSKKRVQYGQSGERSSPGELRGVWGAVGEEEKRRPTHSSTLSLSLCPSFSISIQLYLTVSLVQDELSKLGLKAGGTLQERAARLWRTRGVFSIKDLVKEAPELAAGGNVGGKKRGRRADESVRLVEERAERKLAKQQGPLLPGLGILPSTSRPTCLGNVAQNAAVPTNPGPHMQNGSPGRSESLTHARRSSTGKRQWPMVGVRRLRGANGFSTRGGVLARSFDVMVRGRYGSGCPGAWISEADERHQCSCPAGAVASSMRPLRPKTHMWDARPKEHTIHVFWGVLITGVAVAKWLLSAARNRIPRGCPVKPR